MTTPRGDDQAPEPQPSSWQSYPPAGGYQPWGAPYAPQPPTQGNAIAAMVVGIVALVLACGYGVGLLGSPVAWWLGSTSIRQIDASGGRLGGRGLAQAGRILGIVGTVLLVLLVALVVLFILLAGTPLLGLG